MCDLEVEKGKSYRNPFGYNRMPLDKGRKAGRDEVSACKQQSKARVYWWMQHAKSERFSPLEQLTLS